MFATNQLREMILAQIATAAGALNLPANPFVVRAIVGEFDPETVQVMADIVTTDSDTLPRHFCQVGSQRWYKDPASNKYKMEMIPPLGGWLFSPEDGAITPITIYGYALTTNNGNGLLATHRLETPVVLNEMLDYTYCPPVVFEVPLDFLNFPA